MKIIRSFSYALNGIKYCFCTQMNFKIHLLFTIVAILLGVFLMISLTEWLAITICIGLVICMEMFNTAIEKLCDIVHHEFNYGIKVTKDVSAAAVLVTAIISAIVGIIIFLPKIFFLIKSL